MRLRLSLAFALIVLVSVTSVALIARQGAAREVQAFMLHGSMTGVDELVSALEQYYRDQGSWRGVESVLSLGGAWGGRRGFGNPGAGQGMGPGMGGMMSSQRLRLADASGIVVVDTASTSQGESLTPAELGSAISIEVDGRTVGYLLAEGGMGFSSADQAFLFGRLSRAALVAGLIAGGLSLLLALILTNKLLHPVQELTHAARRLGGGDLSQRVRVSGDDELAVLGSAFNHMADSLQKAEESRRAMTADIAHELRNPLAVQFANLEALQDGIYPLTAEALEPVLEQNRLLNRLVEDLRTLALTDSGQLKLERTPVDLRALVRHGADRFRPQADMQGIGIQVDIIEVEAFPHVMADTLRIEQVLNNLISNAMRYTPSGKSIHLKVESLADRVLVSVRDSGPGIPEEALPHVFERFYRVDRSRSRSEGGIGLGLTIARQLAEAHHGSLVADNHPEGGALFTLTLPLEKQ